MGDIFSTPSQPNSTSSPPSTPSPTMSSSNVPQIHQSIPEKQLKSPEQEILIRETSDSLKDTNTLGVQGNPAEKETLLAKDSEESKRPIQETLSEEDLGESIKEGNIEEGDEEEEGECGFCLFMKGGGCKDTFTEWEKCVEEGEKNNEDIVEKCFKVTEALKKCMEAHSDYYAPVLHAEKAAEEEAAKQLEEEKERLNSSGDEESGKKEKEETLGGSDPK